jgi:hypothetical protein
VKILQNLGASLRSAAFGWHREPLFLPCPCGCGDENRSAGARTRMRTRAHAHTRARGRVPNATVIPFAWMSSILKVIHSPIFCGLRQLKKLEDKAEPAVWVLLNPRKGSLMI